MFWIFVLALVIGIPLSVIYKRTYNRKWYWTGDVGAVTIAIGLIGVCVSLVVMSVFYSTAEAEIDRLNQRYESLVYQYENDIYENDNDIGKRELMKEIQEWNEDLAINRGLQDNFFVGFYVPDIYDQFEFIKLEKTHTSD